MVNIYIYIFKIKYNYIPYTHHIFFIVGFAESTSSDPLKLLHTLLEPNYPAAAPNISFVGLSNWRLNIVKSSRALLVQR
jgi:hypothetical protein